MLKFERNVSFLCFVWSVSMRFILSIKVLDYKILDYKIQNKVHLLPFS